MMSNRIQAPDDDAVVIEQSLQEALNGVWPPRMRSALLTAVSGNAARVRPLFCLAVARAASGREPPPLAWSAAVAVEMIHCASLVHDDLPCFDDAAERRGRPTVHRTYGEATALLAGDALIVAGFAHLARASAPPVFFAELARSASAEGGLISGQALELDERVDVAAYHAAKTGALFEAAARLAATAVDAPVEPFAKLGRALGALYQLADDLADEYGDARMLGKPTGQDRARRRPNAVASLARSKGLALLGAGALETVAAIPRCPGESDLRRFIEELATRLAARALP